MNTVLPIYKPVGVTPLQVIHAVREQFPQYKKEKIGYAGRLDPLAHGVLLLMIGDAAKQRDDYLGLDKTYEFEVLFGLKTDSYDLLGLVTNEAVIKTNVKENVAIFVNEYIKKKTQSYPPYSSKAIQGKPLFWWARNKRLAEITIPERAISIKALELLEFSTLSKKLLERKVKQTINLINGDFRQKEIEKAWGKLFVSIENENFQTAKFRLHCSSGTYVRGFVNDLGEFLGSGAVTLSILRTQVGTFSIDESLKLDSYI